MVDFVVLDSGTGGIPYLSSLLNENKVASYVYIADTANFPYGEKSHEQIVKCSLSVVEQIIAKFDPKVIVIACNTISVNSLDILREVFPDRHFVGTVPAIKLAASVSKNRKIGLLATRSTCEHPYNIDLKNHFASDCQMFMRADPDLVSFIEHKSFTATKEENKKAILPAIKYFAENDCDTIILGCTHFLNLADLFQEVCDEYSTKKIKVIDSREGVTKRARALYDSICKKNGEGKSLPPKLYITGFSINEDKTEYDVICKRNGLQWGGVV